MKPVNNTERIVTLNDTPKTDWEVFDRLPEAVRDMVKELSFDRFDLLRIEALVHSDGELACIQQIQAEDKRRSDLYQKGKKKVAIVTPPNLWKIPKRA